MLIIDQHLTRPDQIISDHIRSKQITPHSRLVDVRADLGQLARDLVDEVLAELVGQVGGAGVVQVAVGLGGLLRSVCLRGESKGSIQSRFQG